MQAEMQDPSTVVMVSSCIVTKYSPGRIFAVHALLVVSQ
jgi:hypothetical protein